MSSRTSRRWHCCWPASSHPSSFPDSPGKLAAARSLGHTHLTVAYRRVKANAAGSWIPGIARTPSRVPSLVRRAGSLKRVGSGPLSGTDTCSPEAPLLRADLARLRRPLRAPPAARPVVHVRLRSRVRALGDVAVPAELDPPAQIAVVGRLGVERMVDGVVLKLSHWSMVGSRHQGNVKPAQR